MTLRKICRSEAPRVLAASRVIGSIFVTPNMTLVIRGNTIPMKTTSEEAQVVSPSAPVKRMKKIGAHAMGAMGLRTSIMGVKNSLRTLNLPMMRPRGNATISARKNPWTSFFKLASM